MFLRLCIFFACFSCTFCLLGIGGSHIGDISAGHLGPLFHSHVGGIRSGHIGPLGYGHIGSVFGGHLLGAPNPNADANSLESPQQYYYDSDAVGSPIQTKYTSDYVGAPPAANQQDNVILGHIGAPKFMNSRNYPQNNMDGAPNIPYTASARMMAMREAAAATGSLDTTKNQAPILQMHMWHLPAQEKVRSVDEAHPEFARFHPGNLYGVPNVQNAPRTVVHHSMFEPVVHVHDHSHDMHVQRGLGHVVYGHGVHGHGVHGHEVYGHPVHGGGFWSPVRRSAPQPQQINPSYSAHIDNPVYKHPVYKHPALHIGPTRYSFKIKENNKPVPQLLYGGSQGKTPKYTSKETVGTGIMPLIMKPFLGLLDPNTQQPIMPHSLKHVPKV